MSRWPTEAPRRIDQPEPGFFRMRLVPKGPHVGAAIVHCNGIWSAWIDNRIQMPTNADHHLAARVMDIWQSGERIDESTYLHLSALSQWAKEHDPTHPLADPTQAVRVGKMKPPF